MRGSNGTAVSENRSIEMRRFNNSICAVIFVFLAILSAEAGAESETQGGQSVGFFVGNRDEGSSNGFTVGAEYEYRLSKLLGIGGFAEYAGGDFDSLVLGVPVTFHPLAGWAFQLAPGVEFNSGTELLFRIGAGYEFEISPQWSLVPKLSVDFVDGDSVFVYGLRGAYKF
jgi:carbohydrate-selective porin OprB